MHHGLIAVTDQFVLETALTCNSGGEMMSGVMNCSLHNLSKFLKFAS